MNVPFDRVENVKDPKRHAETEMSPHRPPKQSESAVAAAALRYSASNVCDTVTKRQHGSRIGEAKRCDALSFGWAALPPPFSWHVRRHRRSSRSRSA